MSARPPFDGRGGTTLRQTPRRMVRTGNRVLRSARSGGFVLRQHSRQTRRAAVAAAKKENGRDAGGGGHRGGLHLRRHAQERRDRPFRADERTLRRRRLSRPPGTRRRHRPPRRRGGRGLPLPRRRGTRHVRPPSLGPLRRIAGGQEGGGGLHRRRRRLGGGPGRRRRRGRFGGGARSPALSPGPGRTERMDLLRAPAGAAAARAPQIRRGRLRTLPHQNTVLPVEPGVPWRVSAPRPLVHRMQRGRKDALRARPAHGAAGAQPRKGPGTRRRQVLGALDGGAHERISAVLSLYQRRR
mmetsp:Transcript_30424/g.69642  ORF Transcript_30424/g.69642 Transcript_30424/m.69642 type:complete len:298 (+) Transcript_30424:464-1357(+)